MSKYSRTDVAKIISMVCDQFNAGFAGREEFVNKTIDYYGNQPKAADESPPASAEEEAARLYQRDPEKNYLYNQGQIIQAQRSAHITCAGMYTGEIERLKAENTQLKKQLQAIKEEHDFRNKPLM